MENYVIEVGISLIVNPSQVGNCKIADTGRPASRSGVPWPPSKVPASLAWPWLPQLFCGEARGQAADAYLCM
jgi:hypothetical protein